MIRQIGPTDLDLFMSHVEMHAKESGNGTTVRFGLRGPSDPFDRDRIQRVLETGLSSAVVTAERTSWSLKTLQEQTIIATREYFPAD